MKLKSASWILFILTALSVTSCTIEKRLFQPGYRIEWKKKIPQKDEAKTEDQVSYNSIETHPDTTGSSSSSLSSLKPDPIPTPQLSKSISEPFVLIENPDTLISYQTETRKVIPSTPQKKAIDLKETEDKKEFELFGVMSFGLYFCSIALALLAVFVFNLPAFLFGIAGFMILLSLIFGIISVDRYKRNRSNYYRNFFGYFGLIASVITISLVIGLLILTSELGSL